MTHAEELYKEALKNSLLGKLCYHQELASGQICSFEKESGSAVAVLNENAVPTIVFRGGRVFPPQILLMSEAQTAECIIRDIIDIQVRYLIELINYASDKDNTILSYIIPITDDKIGRLYYRTEPYINGLATRIHMALFALPRSLDEFKCDIVEHLL